MLTLHLRITDVSTGQPTPVRLRIASPEGMAFAPLGRSACFPTGRNEAVGGHVIVGKERWSYIDGSCEVMLPPSIPLRFQASKGPEYQPLDEVVTLGPGQLSIRLAIKRSRDWRRSLRYYPGDTRCHFLAPHAGLLEAMAEDLDIVQCLARPIDMLAQDGHPYTTVPDLLAFSGQHAALASPPLCSFVVNTFNTHPVLGKVALLHAHRAIFPLTFGGVEETDDWSVCDWCAQCHRKGGLTVWVDAFEWAGTNIGGESLVAAILGRIDAIELDPGPRSQPLLPWLYRLWNLGVRVPLVGASGKDSNRTPLGAMRTYAHLPREFSLPSWIEAIRSGRTFATSGPLLHFQVNGEYPGATVAGDSPLRLVARAESPAPFERLEIIGQHGTVAMAVPVFSPETSSWCINLEREYQPNEPTWLAARCIAKDAFAHTSPVSVRVGDQLVVRPAESVAALVRLVEGTREWILAHGRYRIEKRREQLLARCAEAIAKLEETR